MTTVKIDIEKDLKKIIKIQERIIKANKAENDILERCLKRSYDREDDNKQWAYWYRAWSEYLETCIQRFRESKKKKVFETYFTYIDDPKIKKIKRLKHNVFDL